MATLFLPLMLNSPLAASDSGPVPGETDNLFEAAFFDRFSPRNALEMVERTPGFVLNEGADIRGFGAGAGNVLIDGARPVSKTGGIRQALERIPASAVEYIELQSGTSAGGEAQGHVIIANVRRRGGVTSGTWLVEVEQASDGKVYPRSEFVMSRADGETRQALRLNAFWERFPLQGKRDSYDARGVLQTSRLENRPSIVSEGALAAQDARAIGDYQLTTDARLSRRAFIPRTNRLIFNNRLPDPFPDEQLFIETDQRYNDGELGLDLSRELSSGAWKAIGLFRFKNLDEMTESRLERPVGALTSRSQFVSVQDSREAVLRSTFNFTSNSSATTTIGAEITANQLESTLQLQMTASGVTSTRTLPAANIRVKEIRGESFATLEWQPSSSSRIEGGLAIETSTISVNGDANASSEFVFFKPSLVATLDVNDNFQVNASAQRVVQQLDFTDFAASVEVDQDRQFAGNPHIKPEQRDRVVLGMDTRNDSGALRVELFHEWRSDVLEQVLLQSGSAGLGNAGNAPVFGLTLAGSLKLDRLISGSLLEIELNTAKAAFFDPLTLGKRSLSNVVASSGLVRLRRDLPDKGYSWGLTYTLAQRSNGFFLTESSAYLTGDEWSFFAETTRIPWFKTRFALKGIGSRRFVTDRVLYTPDRRGISTGGDITDRDRGMFATLTFSSQFE